MPGFLKATHEWFMIYKVPDGKPRNTFAFGGEFKNKEFALEIIKETNVQWQKLLAQQCDAGDLSCENVSVASSPYRVSHEEAKQVVESVSCQSKVG